MSTSTGARGSVGAAVAEHGCMRHRTPLPEHLGNNFSVAQSAAAGVGRGRRSARDLARPFHGVRARVAGDTFRDRVREYAPRMREGQRLIGRSAVRAWGLPFPVRWREDEKLEVAAPLGASPPRTVGVKGRRLSVDRARTWRVGPVAVVDPIAAVFSCAAELTVTQAVVLIDALLTDADNYPGLLPGRPVYSRDDIAARLKAWGPFKGCASIRAALAMARDKVESPKETETRLMMVAGGLPEPLVQYEEYDGVRLVARIDLAYPEWKIAIEYEGDRHRTDKEQWRRDIRRQRELDDRGWIVIRLTQADLRDVAALLDRIRRAIASRIA